MCFTRSGRAYAIVEERMPLWKKGYSPVTNTAQQVLMHIVLNVLDLRSYYETSHSKNYNQNTKDM